MAAGRTFRPGPRAEYKQRPLRFTDDTLETTEIASPLDVGYAPGGTRWRQINATAYTRRWPYGQIIRHQMDTDAPPVEVTGTIAVTQDDDVATITGTFTDPAYGDGGIRFRQGWAAYRRPASEAYYLQRNLGVPPVETYTGTVAATQDDDVAAITGTFTDPAYGDGGVRARQQSSVYRRLASRIPFTRHLISVPPDYYPATIAVTQDDDTAAIIGTFTDPDYLGDGGVRARAQSASKRRLLSRIPFLRRSASAPAPDPVTGTIGVTQDDDTASIAGTFSDPLPPWDGGIRHRQIAGRRPRRPVYCQRRYTIDVGTAVPDLPPLVPPFAAFLDAYQATTGGATRATTVMTQTVTSTVGTTPRAMTRNTTPQGETT